jgi:hypothetical protein
LKRVRVPAASSSLLLLYARSTLDSDGDGMATSSYLLGADGMVNATTAFSARSLTPTMTLSARLSPRLSTWLSRWYPLSASSDDSCSSDMPSRIGGVAGVSSRGEPLADDAGDCASVRMGVGTAPRCCSPCRGATDGMPASASSADTVVGVDALIDAATVTVDVTAVDVTVAVAVAGALVAAAVAAVTAVVAVADGASTADFTVASVDVAVVASPSAAASLARCDSQLSVAAASGASPSSRCCATEASRRSDDADRWARAVGGGGIDGVAGSVAGCDGVVGGSDANVDGLDASMVYEKGRATG